MGTTYLIDTIRVYPRQDFDQASDRTGWLIQVSNDPAFTDCVDLGRRLEPGEMTQPTVIEPELSEGYRYVRVANLNYFVVGEIEVEGEEIQTGDNVPFSDLDEEKYKMPAELLRYLGVMEGISIDQFAPYHLLTRAEAAKIVVTLTGAVGTGTDQFADLPRDHWANSYVDAGLKQGLISADTLFRPDDYVTAVELLKMVLVASGRSRLIEAKGGYPMGVISVASELKIANHVKGEFNEPINRIDTALVLYNILQSPACVISSITSENVLVQESDESYLTYHFGLVIHEGMVTANQLTTLTRAQEKHAGYVEIDGNVCQDETGMLDQYLGYDIYYLTTDDEPERILLAWNNTSRNEVICVEEQDILSAETDRVVYDDNGKERKVTFEKGISVIKNGVVYPQWTTADLRPVDGYLQFVDHDADGTADLLEIFEPIVIVCDVALEQNGIYIGGLNDTELRLEETPARLLVTEDGRNRTLADLSRGDLIYAYVSENEKSLVIELVSESISARLDELGADFLIADGVQYPLTAYFNDNIDQMDAFSLGETVTIVVDGAGRVVWIIEEDGGVQTEELGYIIATQLQSLNGIQFKIFDQNGAFIVVEPARNITVDGERLSTNELYRMAEETDRFTCKFVQYRLNAAGDISYMDTEYYNAALEPDSVMIKSTVDVGTESSQYLANLNGIYDRNMMRMPLEADSIAFCIPTYGAQPTSDATYDEYYRASVVSDIFPNQYQLTEQTAFYGQDEFGFPYFAVMYVECEGRMGGAVTVIEDESAPGYVVDYLSRSLDQEGNLTYKLHGYELNSGKEAEVLISDAITYVYDSWKIQQEHSEWLNNRWMLDPSKFDEDLIGQYRVDISSISRGDVVRCQMNGSLAIALERVFAFSDTPIDSYSSADGSFYNAGTNATWPFTSFKAVYGTVTEIGDGKIKMDTSVGNSETLLYDKIPVVLYCTHDKVIKESADSLRAVLGVDSRLFLYTRYSQNVAIVVYDYAG